MTYPDTLKGFREYCKENVSANVYDGGGYVFQRKERTGQRSGCEVVVEYTIEYSRGLGSRYQYIEYKYNEKEKTFYLVGVGKHG